jgi:hypothetical protein
MDDGECGFNWGLAFAGRARRGLRVLDSTSIRAAAREHGEEWSILSYGA